MKSRCGRSPANFQLFREVGPGVDPQLDWYLDWLFPLARNRALRRPQRRILGPFTSGRAPAYPSVRAVYSITTASIFPSFSLGPNLNLDSFKGLPEFFFKAMAFKSRPSRRIPGRVNKPRLAFPSPLGLSSILICLPGKPV